MMFVRSRKTLALALLAGLIVVLTGCGSSDGTEEPGDDYSPTGDQTITAHEEAEALEPPDVVDDERNVSGRVEDARIAARVKQRLYSESSLRTFDFDPEVVDGEVVLWGDVRSRDQYERAKSLAEDVDGVREVHNALTVEGQSVASAREEDDGDERGDPPSAEFHTVQSGESLWIIARSYDTSVERVQQLNDISGTNVQPGDRIRVR